MSWSVQWCLRWRSCFGRSQSRFPLGKRWTLCSYRSLWVFKKTRSYSCYSKSALILSFHSFPLMLCSLILIHLVILVDSWIVLKCGFVDLTHFSCMHYTCSCVVFTCCISSWIHHIGIKNSSAVFTRMRRWFPFSAC